MGEMTYQEKKSIVTLLTAVLLFVGYGVYMLPQRPDGGWANPDVLRFWGTYVLVLTVVSIVVHIGVSIVFNLLFRMTTGEKEPSFMDELDRLIELKAHRNSFFVFVVGFVLAMGSLVFREPSELFFVILIVSGFLADMIGSVTKLYHYRSGV